jgi:N-acyl-D-amino-acid deacylase
MLDLVIKNGHVVDGTGNPWFNADVGIQGERIAKIGRLSKDKALRVLDVSGLIVSPGFIDMHSHSDLLLLINPKAESKIRQGVTTEVIGNCGDSAAPLDKNMREEAIKTSPFVKEAKLKLDWSTMAEYLRRLDRQGIAVNVAPLVGHGNVRACAMGFANRAPTGNEMETMKKTLAKAMNEGAFGMSTGLIYPPGCYSKTEELIELSAVVAKCGGIYTSHIRGEGENLLKSVKEAITIGKKAALTVEISHHKAGGKANWGKVKQSLKVIEEARARGVDVTCDVYPYIAASFGLSAMLPPWTYEGGTDKLLERLRDPAIRSRLRKEMETGFPDWPSPLKAAGWDCTVISHCRNHPQYEGKSIEEITRPKKIDPFEFTFDLLIEEKASVGVVRFAMCEEDVQTVLQHPVSMIGSDSSAVAPYGILGKGKPHPRAYGTFPRVLGKYVREERLLGLENAVRKMTSLPAQKLGLRDRGLIRPQMYADITVFDLQKIADKASYAEPHQYPEGVEYVIVNGKIVIDGKEHTGVLAGKALRRNQLSGS